MKRVFQNTYLPALGSFLMLLKCIKFCCFFFIVTNCIKFVCKVERYRTVHKHTLLLPSVCPSAWSVPHQVLSRHQRMVAECRDLHYRLLEVPHLTVWQTLQWTVLLKYVSEEEQLAIDLILSSSTKIPPYATPPLVFYMAKQFYFKSKRRWLVQSHTDNFRVFLIIITFPLFSSLGSKI